MFLLRTVSQNRKMEQKWQNCVQKSKSLFFSLSTCISCTSTLDEDKGPHAFSHIPSSTASRTSHSLIDCSSWTGQKRTGRGPRRCLQQSSNSTHSAHIFLWRTPWSSCCVPTRPKVRLQTKLGCATRKTLQVIPEKKFSKKIRIHPSQSQCTWLMIFSSPHMTWIVIIMLAVALSDSLHDNFVLPESNSICATSLLYPPLIICGPIMTSLMNPDGCCEFVTGIFSFFYFQFHPPPPKKKIKKNKKNKHNNNKKTLISNERKSSFKFQAMKDWHNLGRDC